LVHEIFDKLASGKIDKADIFVGWASFALDSFKKAKKMGMTVVLDEGSSHILYRRDIVKEEYEKFGIKPELTHPKLIEKELREYEEADYIAVSSLFAKRTFLEKGIPERKIIHVPYGVNLSDFKQIPKNDNVFRVVFAGGMSLRKGAHYLLQAFSELNLPNSELMLIGSINDEIKPFFKKYEGKFKWLGHIPQQELYKYYSQGSVFVLNSIEDGFGMVIIQAMACGLPVIATTNTGGEDIIREGRDGFIIPIRDVPALKEKLLYLYKNPEISKIMGQSAKERVSAGFTWDDYGEKIIKEYERI
jgi:glycosyltransferase involved in cell wall biosynthesis